MLMWTLLRQEFIQDALREHMVSATGFHGSNIATVVSVAFNASNL